MGNCCQNQNEKIDYKNIVEEKTKEITRADILLDELIKNYRIKENSNNFTCIMYPDNSKYVEYKLKYINGKFSFKQIKDFDPIYSIEMIRDKSKTNTLCFNGKLRTISQKETGGWNKFSMQFIPCEPNPTGDGRFILCLIYLYYYGSSDTYYIKRNNINKDKDTKNNIIEIRVNETTKTKKLNPEDESEVNELTET